MKAENQPEDESVIRRGVLILPILIVAFVIYWAANMLNPDSVFCLYKIYKQKDGTYQVWWVNKSRHCELTSATYEQAKLFQVKECRELRAYIWQRPPGELTK